MDTKRSCSERINVSTRTAITSKTLGELLDKAPNRPPDPGDEFES
jgi:hypothetical protein